MKTLCRGNLRGAPLLALLMLCALPAWAQKPVPSLGHEPVWEKNVPRARQEAAVAPFEEGNRLLKESLFKEAEKKYREALHLWEHPATYYNLALVLQNLDRPSEVYEYMVASIVHGAAPLGEERFKHAQKYIERMEHENARVKLACESDTSVTLKSEWQHLPVSCTRFERLLRPGAYLLSTTYDGYQVPDMPITLAAGQQMDSRLEVQSQRRWAAWKPWAVVGAGVVLAAGGRMIHLQARNELRAFDAQINDLGGWMPPSGLEDTRPHAKNLQRVAIGSYALGGAAVITGLSLVYANRLQPRLTLIPLRGSTWTVTPVVGSGETGVQASLPF